jgi:hypothetical protein
MMSGDNEIGLHPEQIEELTASTPKESIHSRPSPWGGEIEYVTGEYVKRKLMKAFNGALRVTVREIETVEDCILTHISLEYPITQFCKTGNFVNDEWARIDEVGVSTIRKQGSTTNYSTAIKASHTDALKRAATHLGIGLDLYEKTSVMETKMEGHQQAMANNSTPDWVQPAQKAAYNPTKKTAPSSFNSTSLASDKQKGYLKSLLKRVQPNYDASWLNTATGIPVEQFNNDFANLGKNEASSVIDILKEMEHAQNE